MRFVVLALLIVAAHFSLTPFAPAPAGKGSFYWPFAADSKPRLDFVGGLPRESGAVTAALAGIAGLGLVAAALALFGIAVPADWFPALVIVASVASALLYALYFRSTSLLPLAIDLVLLGGVILQHWTVSKLGG